jgi:hypothetical protein
MVTWPKNDANQYGWGFDTFNKRVIVSLQEVVDMLDKLKVPVEGAPIPLRKLVPIDIHLAFLAKHGKVSKETHNRAMSTDLKCPIIVTVEGGKLRMILDGNHRVYKAAMLDPEHKTIIRVRLLDLSQTPADWIYLFGRDWLNNLAT